MTEIYDVVYFEKLLTIEHFSCRIKKHTSNASTLEVSGSDQPGNPETLQWELEETEINLWQEPPDHLLIL